MNSQLEFQIEPELRKFLAENVLFSGQGYPYSDDTSFLRTGVIDSMGIMELITYLETRYGIDVPVPDITPEDFDSITLVAGYVRRRLAERATSVPGEPARAEAEAQRV
jgi:acyl carrier protein